MRDTDHSPGNSLPPTSSQDALALQAARGRDAFRLAFTDAIRPLSDPRAIKRAAAERLGDYLRCSRALYAEVLDGGRTVVVEDDHCRDGMASIAGRHAMGRYGRYTSDRLQRGETVAVDAIDGNAGMAPEQQAAYLSLGIASLLAVPLVKDGQWVACLVVHQAVPRAWSPDDIALLEEVAERTWSEVERARSEARLRESERRLQAELEDTKLLHEVSATLIHEEDSATLYGVVVDGAMKLMGAQFASLQTLHPDIGRGRELELLAYRGFSAAAAEHWQWVRPDSATTCGLALLHGTRVLEADIESATVLAGSGELPVFRDSGIRAVQTTPLRARDGRIVGMISTHWAQPYVPSERQLRLFDILAREAADLLERRQVEAALREANQRKDEFLATLAHELRNPLAPLANGLYLLQRMAPDSPEIGAQVDMMRRQLGNLGRLVDDLLEVSRISRGVIELRKAPVALADIVLSAVETSRPLVDQAGHTLAIELPPQPLVVHADAFRLAQALSNLINNAAKYTPEGGRIEVVLDADDGMARLSVRDNGVGLPPDLLPHVFDMFIQGEHTRERQQGGLGIGLTLVRSLVELHGGRISAHSEGIGTGSEFVIRLPLADPLSAPARPSAAHSAATARSRQSVLIVDDNRDAADSLAVLLRLSGRDVRTAYDCDGCMEAIGHARPDVVLLDLGMPDVDGFEVCRRIRAVAGTDISVIALSGWGRDRDRERTREAGFDMHLTKPVDPDFLLYELDRLAPRAPRPA